MDNFTTIPLEPSIKKNNSDSGFETLLSFMTISMWSLGLSAILMNLLFLAAVRSMRKVATTSDYLMQNMSVADLLAALLFLLNMHFHPPYTPHKMEDEFSCTQSLLYAARGTPWLFFTGYLLTLMCLGITQYLAVCHPSRYSGLMTKRNNLICVALVWLIASMQTNIPLFIVIVTCVADRTYSVRSVLRLAHVEMQVWMVLFALISLISITLNILVHRRIRQIEQTCRNIFCDLPQRSQIQEKQSLRIKRAAVITVTSLLIVGVICRLPFPLFALGVINLLPVLGEESTYAVNSAIVVMLYFNFLADPVIYVIRMAEMRTLVRKIINSCSVRNSRSRRSLTRRDNLTPVMTAAHNQTTILCNDMEMSLIASSNMQPLNPRRSH